MGNLSLWTGGLSLGKVLGSGTIKKMITDLMIPCFCWPMAWAGMLAVRLPVGLWSRPLLSPTNGLLGQSSDRLRACLQAANDALASAIDNNPELDGMGTTVVAVVVSPRGLEWISVGDSPLWLFREGQLRRLNADHSMAAVFADMVAAGRMTEEEAATDPKRHALRAAVMGDEIHLIDVSSQPVAIAKRDRVLLASDGLMTLSDQEIARILQAMRDAPLSEVTEALIKAVEDVGRPNQDNTTVLLYTPEADRGVASVAADPPQRQGEQGNPRLNRIRQWLSPTRKTGLVGIAICVVLLAALLGYWFSLDKDTPVKTPDGSDVETPAPTGAEGDTPAAQADTTDDSTRALSEKKAEVTSDSTHALPEKGMEATRDSTGALPNKESEP